MTEITGNVARKGSLDQAADGIDVLGRHLEVVASDDRQDRNRDPVQDGGGVVGYEVAEPAGVDALALVLALQPDRVGAHQPQDEPGRCGQPGGQLLRLPGEDLTAGPYRPGQQHDAVDCLVSGQLGRVEGPLAMPDGQPGKPRGPGGQPAQRSARVGEPIGHPGA
jgi:hypothetical protein